MSNTQDIINEVEPMKEDNNRIYLSKDNNAFIKELETIQEGSLKYILSKYNNLYIIEVERENEIIKTITIHLENKRVCDYEGCYFLNKIVTKLLRNNKIVVGKECLK